MSEEKKGILEMLEVIAGLELVGVAGAKIMADGQVNTSDFGTVVSLLTEFNVLVEAVKGANEIVAEAKDLDQAELLELGTRIYEVVRKIKAELNA